MKVYVHGITTRKGTFTNQSSGEIFDYDNYIFHVSMPSSDGFTVGDEVHQIKMKSKIASLDRSNLSHYTDRWADIEVAPKMNGSGFNYVGITFED